MDNLWQSFALADSLHMPPPPAEQGAPYTSSPAELRGAERRCEQAVGAAAEAERGTAELLEQAAPLHTPAHPCTPLHTAAHPAHSCTPPHTLRLTRPQ